MERVHLVISGRVQGVWFRASTRRAAEEFGVCGWVRNLADGRVEAMAEGDRASLDQLVAWAWKGPAAARVEAVLCRWRPADGSFSDFSVGANAVAPEA